jgi:hypothetical protein
MRAVHALGGTDVAPAQAIRRNSMATVVLFALAVATLLWPIISNPIPLLLDYAGHLSRIFVLYNLIHGTGFPDMYRIHLAVVPNLAVDGVVLALMQLGLPVEAAGRCFLVLMLLSLAIGVVLLHFAAFRRVSIWPVLALPFLYQEVMFWGFLNFLLGVGLALITVAFWRLSERASLWRSGVLLLICSLVLFFTHLFAVLLVFGMLVGVEFSSILRTTHSSRKKAWVRLAVSMVASAAPLSFLLFAPLIADNAPPTFDALRHAVSLQSIESRLKALLWFAWGYDPTLDTICLYSVMALTAYVLIRRSIRFDVPSLLPIVGLLVIYLLVPDGWFHTAYLPDRLPFVLFLLAFAATDVRPTWRWEQFGLIIIVAALTVSRGIAVERAWVSANVAFKPLFAALPSISKGARVAYAVAYEGDYSHLLRVPFPQLMGYATIYRGAFYPETYADPSQNIVVRQPIYEKAPKLARSYKANTLLDRPDDDPYDPLRLGFYDYILVVNLSLWPQPPPSSLEPVLATPDYTLFRINHPIQK